LHLSQEQKGLGSVGKRFTLNTGGENPPGALMDHDIMGNGRKRLLKTGTVVGEKPLPLRFLNRFLAWALFFQCSQRTGSPSW
jgi:hypothetical protein